MSSDDRKEHPEKERYSATPLIDLLLKVSPYIPQRRINKWIRKLREEDLEYVIDLMRLSDTSLSVNRGKFSVGLYDLLRRVHLMPIMEVHVVPQPKNHQVCIRERYGGCYVDRGGTFMSNHVFVKVGDRLGLEDPQQMICYKWNNDAGWRFHEVQNTDQGYYMIMSDGNEDRTTMDQLKWKMGLGQGVQEPIRVEIMSWNC